MMKLPLLLLFFLFLAACSPEVPPPVPETSPSPVPQAEATVITGATPPAIPEQTASPTVTAVPPSPTPTPEPTGMPLQPVATAASLRVDGWSPGGDWLAYWAAPEGAQEVPPDAAQAVLHFHQASTGKECSVPQVVWQEQGEPLMWQADGMVLVAQAGEAWQGRPCQGDFTPLPEPPVETDTVSALSRGENYRAETTVLDNTVGILSLETRLLALPDNQVINAVEWKIDERLGEIGLGGEWLAGHQFLIYETLDQGPLLLTVSGEVIPVAQELFQVEEVPSLLDPSGISLRAAGAGAPDSDGFHLALYALGAETNFPPVRLYHSETEQVEEMPFNYPWSPAFSADGRWLLLDERPIRDGFEGYALWVRAVDPAGSPLRSFAGGSPYSLWSPTWDQVAFGLPGSVSVYAFPEGGLHSSWITGDYTAVPAAWSPDGEALAAVGAEPGEVQQALFIIKLAD